MGLKTLKTIQATMFKVVGYVSFCKNVNVNVKKNVNVICLPTEHQGVHRTRPEMSVHSRIELEFGDVGFC